MNYTDTYSEESYGFMLKKNKEKKKKKESSYTAEGLQMLFRGQLTQCFHFNTNIAFTLNVSKKPRQKRNWNFHMDISQ